MTSDMAELGDAIREYRDVAGVSQTALAEAIGIPRAHLAQIESGKISLPSADTRRRLAAALGVRHIDLLVAAGELRPDELPEEGAPRDLFPSETDIRREVLAALERVSPDTDLKRRILRSVVGTLEELEKPEPFA